MGEMAARAPFFSVLIVSTFSNTKATACNSSNVELRGACTLFASCLTPQTSLPRGLCNHTMNKLHEGIITCLTVAAAVLTTLSVFLAFAKDLKQIPRTAAIASCSDRAVLSSRPRQAIEKSLCYGCHWVCIPHSVLLQATAAASVMSAAASAEGPHHAVFQPVASRLDQQKFGYAHMWRPLRLIRMHTCSKACTTAITSRCKIASLASCFCKLTRAATVSLVLLLSHAARNGLRKS